MKHEVKKISTIRIKLENGFYIDIIEAASTKDIGAQEYWLHHEDCGKAMMMFGIDLLPDEQAIEMALTNAEQYIQMFNEDTEE